MLNEWIDKGIFYLEDDLLFDNRTNIYILNIENLTGDESKRELKDIMQDQLLIETENKLKGLDGYSGYHLRNINDIHYIINDLNDIIETYKK